MSASEKPRFPDGEGDDLDSALDFIEGHMGAAAAMISKTIKDHPDLFDLTSEDGADDDLGISLN
jgi:hypothetical protein